jgi:hypothetical protein
MIAKAEDYCKATVPDTSSVPKKEVKLENASKQGGGVVVDDVHIK